MRRSSIVFFTLFIFFYSVCLSQSATHNADLKFQIVNRSLNDSLKCVAYNTLSFKSYNLKQLQLQKEYADSAYYYAYKSRSDALLLKSRLSQILVYSSLKDTAEVSLLFDDGFKILEQTSLPSTQEDVISFKLEHIDKIIVGLYNGR